MEEKKRFTRGKRVVIKERMVLDPSRRAPHRPSPLSPLLPSLSTSLHPPLLYIPFLLPTHTHKPGPVAKPPSVPPLVSTSLPRFGITRSPLIASLTN
ncbi:hypothetical protein E2C01_043330 [Portunus trituberculatus]|uniref:Uncharacterized protein n=1 Tax=Portunus trituberculatus TaxID=210409 RepID=A0A5B7FVV2_PORTR|nr:hypothetical protein [Portunus trituberculatus]